MKWKSKKRHCTTKYSDIFSRWVNVASINRLALFSECGPWSRIYPSKRRDIDFEDISVYLSNIPAYRGGLFAFSVWPNTSDTNSNFNLHKVSQVIKLPMNDRQTRIFMWIKKDKTERIIFLGLLPLLVMAQFTLFHPLYDQLFDLVHSIWQSGFGSFYPFVEAIAAYTMTCPNPIKTLP